MAKKDTKMDTGFSWVVLVCSFLSLYSLCFMSATAGIIQVEIVEDLKVGSGIVSIMTAVALGLASLLGPLCGVLSNLISIRYTVFLGTVLLSIGLLLASFSTGIWSMMFFYGTVSGIGLGITYTPCIVIISMYFDKRHILACGVILCAAGLGILSVPYFVRYVIDAYGWRYAMALNAGIVLHVFVFASFFRPTELERRRMLKPSWWCCQRERVDPSGSRDAPYDDDDDDDELTADVREITGDDTTRKGDDSPHRNAGETTTSDGTTRTRNGSCGDAHSLASSTIISAHPVVVRKAYTPVYINGTPEAAKSFLRSPLTDLIFSEAPRTGVSLSTEDVHLESGRGSRRLLSNRDLSGSLSKFSSHSFVVSCTEMTPSSTLHPMSHLTPLTSRRSGENRPEKSLLSSSLRFASAEFGSSVMLPIKIEPIPSPDEVDISVMATLKRVCGQRAMWLMCLHCLFFMSGSGMQGVHFPSYVHSQGLSTHYVAHFYTVYGIALLSGRLFGSMIYNRFKPPLFPLLFGLEVVNALVLGLLPFYATGPASIFLFQGSLALSYGQSYMLQAPLVAQMVTVEDIPIAFGVTQLFNGIGYMVAPVLAGFIYDVTNTYDIPMHMAGSFILIGAFALLAMSHLVKTDQLSRAVDEETDTEEEEKHVLAVDEDTNKGQLEEGRREVTGGPDSNPRSPVTRRKGNV